MSGEPDFARLARESLFTAKHWQLAWDLVQVEPRLWETVVAMVEGGGSPIWAASALSKALAALPAAQPDPGGAAEGDER